MSVRGPSDLEPCDDPAGHNWREFEGYCETCGEHPAVMCETCCEVVDLIWYDDPREEA